MFNGYAWFREAAMKILLADDDRDLVDLLRYSFQRDGYAVVTAFDGEAALRVLEIESPDVVVLDMMMPKRSGMDVLHEMRRSSQVPIIILTALGDEEHAVSALRAGADDYVTKPFRPRELRARVEVSLRRARVWDMARRKQGGSITCGEVTLDPQRREVTVAGRPVQLTRIEFTMLHYLMLNRDIVVSVSDILANVWNYAADQNEDVVKVTVSRLRRKLEADPSHPCYIITVPGAGYMFKYKA
jgi:DNA-binding response OmpR family regulator